MQYPPPYGPPGYGRPPYAGGPPPGMRPPGMPFAPPPMQQPPMVYPMAPIIKKTTLYIGKIATTVSDTTMEALLNACGPLVSWKPMKDADTQAPKGFGFAEFQEADGVYRATQLLQGLDVDGQQLMVKPDTATQRYLDSYMHRHPEVAAAGNDEALAKVMEVLSSLAAARTADKAAAEFLADVAGPAQAQGATPENRKRTREEREAMERAFKNTLHDWERHERDRMKLLEADRERERRAEAERMRTVRLDLQGSAADDEPRWRRPLYMDSRYAADRRRRRQREEEEDEADQRKEADDAAARQREEEEARAAAERRTTAADQAEAAAKQDGAVKTEGAAEGPGVDSNDPIYQAMMAAAQAVGQAPPVKPEEVKPVKQEEVKPVKLEEVKPVKLAAPVVAPQRVVAKRVSKPLATVTAFDDDDDDEEEGPKRRTLIPIKYTAEEEAALQTGPRLGEQTVPAVDIKTIADAIPTSKDEVFAAVVDWSVLSERVLSTLRSWVGQKVTELLGEEEPSLVDFIADKLAAHTSAPALLSELTEVLDEEAEGFVLRLYRTVLYETKKAAAGL